MPVTVARITESDAPSYFQCSIGVGLDIQGLSSNWVNLDSPIAGC